MNVVSSDVLVIFPCERDESECETTELVLMDEQERNKIEAEVIRLTSKIRTQEDLLNIKDSTAKAQRELFKEKYQKLQDEVTLLRNEVNEKNKELKDRSSYYENIEATIFSLKGDLEESRK